MTRDAKKLFSLRMSEEEFALLERAAKRHKGNKTKAIVEGLRKECGANEISKATILAEIDRRMK